MERPDDTLRALHTRSPVLFALGDWRIRVTGILRREHRRRFQQCLVLPPRGFDGNVRFSVIDGHRRQESTGHWTRGQDAELPESLRAPLARLTSRLFAPELVQGEPQPAADLIEETPSVLSIPVGDARAHEFVRVNLLFEADNDKQTEPSNRLSGGLGFLRAGSGATVYLMPVLTAAGAPPAAVMQDVLRAFERHPSLRIAVSPASLPPGDDLKLAGKLRAAAGAGQLEILLDSPSAAAADSSRAATSALPFPPLLPFPAQTGLIRAGDGQGAIDALEERGARRLLVVCDSPEQLPALAMRREMGAVIRMRSSKGALLAHIALLVLQTDPFSRSAAPFAVALLHQLWVEAIRLADAVVAGAPKTRWLAACPLFIAHARGLTELGRRIDRWNAEHVSPRIVIATPADFFATVEELESRGLIRPRPLY